jgi:hypothetical protein
MAEINIDRIGGTGGAPTPLPLGNLKVDNPLSTALQIVKDTGGNASALYISTIDVTNFGGGAIASNTAFGINALIANTTGSANIAIGQNALLTNTTAGSNTAVGVSSMRINLTGGSNTALGAESLRFNVNGNNNTAIGRNALFDVQTGSDNTAIGYNAGRGITTGSNNTILGANVTGLSATLANNIIIADGSGNQRINVDSSGNVGINTLTPSQKLHVNGSLRIETGGIYDGTNNIGTSGQVLSSTGTSTAWITPSGGGGSPSGVAGAIQFSDGSAFASDAANLFWDDTNNRLGIGTNAPSTSIETTGSIRLSGSGSQNLEFSNASLARFRAISGAFSFRSSTGVFISNADGTPSARLHVKGSGTTSATTSLLVQNSAGTEVLKVTDDSVTNARGSFNVLHPSVATRSLKLGWGSIFATDSGSELTIGAVYSVPSSPQILLAGNARGSGANTMQLQASAGVSIATSLINPSAQLHVKGSGTTSATTALLVQNSAGAQNFKVADNGSVQIGTFNFVSSTVIENTTTRLVATTGGVAVNSSYAFANASSILDVSSTTKGFLPPRMTQAQILAIAAPATGLMAYNLDIGQVCVFDGAIWHKLNQSVM